MLDSLFKKITDLKRLQDRCFPVKIAKFLRLSTLRNIYKLLHFDCFNGSLLHGLKGTRPRLYDGVRLQVPALRSIGIFCLKPSPDRC